MSVAQGWILVVKIEKYLPKWLCTKWYWNLYSQAVIVVNPFSFSLPIARKKEYLYGFAPSILVLLQCDCSCNKTVDCGVFDDSWLFVCWGATKIVEKHSVEVLWCWYHFRISVISTQPHRGLVLPIYFSKKNDKSGTSGNRLCFWRGLYFVLPLKSSVGICANCVF